MGAVSPAMLRARPCLAAIVVATAVFVLTLLSPLRTVGADTVPGRLGAVTLRCRGNQDLSDIDHVAQTVMRGLRVYYVRPALEGRALVSIFGPGPAWLGALTMSGLEPGAIVTDGMLRTRARVAAALAVAVSGAFLVLAASACVSVPIAVALALAAALSFGGAASLGQGLWQQTPALPLLTGALAAAFWCKRWPWLLPVVTASTACAAWLRPADLPILLAVCAFATRRALRARASLAVVAVALGAGALGALPPMSWFLWYLDTPLPLAQWDVNQRITEHVFFDSARHVALGFAGLLVSPGRGIVLWGPLVPVVVGLTAVLHRRVRSDASKDALVLALGMVVQFALAGSFFKWWGGASYGPRLLAGAMWVAAAAGAIAWQHGTATERRALVVCGALGMFWGTLGLFRFDIANVEAELNKIHRPESYFEWRAGPWTSVFAQSGRTLLDAQPGPFQYCGGQSLGPVPPS